MTDPKTRRGLLADVRWKAVAGILALALIVVALWDTGAVYPLKILVVFLHELSHAAAAIITGGRVEEIVLNRGEGGYCVTRDGNAAAILTAGYLGSVLWGGLILILASRTRADRIVSIALGSVLMVVTLAWVGPAGSFGHVFGLATGAVLVLCGALLSGGKNDLILRVIGVTSCLYAVNDIKADILDRPQVRSDAAMLAEVIGGSTWHWGVVWIAFAAAASFGFLVIACRRTDDELRAAAEG